MNAGTMDRLWHDYAEHHRTEGNKHSHMIGIPLIIIGVLGLCARPLFQVGGWTVELAVLLIAVAGAVYIALDARLGVAMVAVDVLLYLVARQLGWKISLALFALGWVFQFIGRGVYEKRRPAFYKNLAHLLVGPLWVLNHFWHLRRGPAQPVANQS